MKKRLFSILTALCLCLSLLPTAALAEEEINTAAVKVISCSAWPENGKWYPDSSAESLFDGDSTTSWDWELNNNSSRVRFETSEPISLVSYTLSTGKTWNRSDFNPVSWTLNASNNGEDWVQIHSVTDGGLSTTPAQNKIFTVSPLIDKYSYYEFVFTVRSGGHITLGEIELVQSTCPHTDCEETVTPPTCTTGGSTYRECKACHATQTTNFTSALGHAFGEDGVCTRSGCTAERSDFQAVLKTASDLQYYTSVYEALNAAQEKTGCTVQMLSDAEMNRITLSKGNFTLDLNGYTLKASSDLTFLISNHAHITLVNTDSSKLAKVLSNAYMVIPSNLCKRRLHNFLIGKTQCELRHVFQVSHRVAGGVRKRNFNVGGKIFNKFVAPCLVLVDDLADGVVENQQLSIDTDRSTVLRRADLLLDRFDDIQIFVGIHQHFSISSISLCSSPWHPASTSCQVLSKSSVYHGSATSRDCLV